MLFGSLDIWGNVNFVKNSVKLIKGTLSLYVTLRPNHSIIAVISKNKNLKHDNIFKTVNKLLQFPWTRAKSKIRWLRNFQPQTHSGCRESCPGVEGRPFFCVHQVSRFVYIVHALCTMKCGVCAPIVLQTLVQLRNC